MKTNLLRSVQKRHLIQAVFLLCFSIGFSQVSVSGTITDSATSEVLPVHIILLRPSG
jgi:hypothetical protein